MPCFLTRPTHDRVDLDEQKETSHEVHASQDLPHHDRRVRARRGRLVPAAQAQDEEFIPGTDFPNACGSGRSETFVPGHSDFPNHLRVDSKYDQALGNGGVEERVVLVPAGGGFDWTDAGIGAAARPVSSSSRPAAPCWRSAGPPGAALTG